MAASIVHTVDRFDPRRVVAAKRDGLALDDERLREFVLRYARGEISDALAASFLMAVYLNGLSEAETAAMTRAMVDSGSTVALNGIGRPKVDKHSTGGVSDGVTLVFAPLAASMGLAVAKLSGRGLGHTGGTLDKLEAIPGLRTDLSIEEIEHQVQAVGCAISAQTIDLVPADGALYALRDATATVGSLPLIASSVMSKKLAVGSDLMLLDVKAGSGAFMRTAGQAEALALACVDLARRWGRPACVLVTDMSQPLGTAIGNALEIAETVRVLRGDEHGSLRELALRFVVEAAVPLLGLTPQEARRRAERALDHGEAAGRFAAMVEAQGGDRRVVDDPTATLPHAPVRLEIAAPSDGWLAAADAQAIGRAAVDLGAGRVRKGDRIDPAVGIELEAKIGDRLARGRPIGAVHARSPEEARHAADAVLAALTLDDSPAAAPPLVLASLHA